MVRFTVSALVLASSLAVTPAMAQGGEVVAWLWAGAALKACGGDAARLCGAVVPGGGRMAQCLVSQEDKLSAPCRGFIDKTKATRNAFLACSADAQRLCAEVAPGGGRVVACLNRQHDALSKECSRSLDEATAAFKN